MSDLQEIQTAVHCYYDALAASWGDDTAAEGYRPLPSDMPASYGQCMPTSCVLMERLQQDFPDETNLQLAWGRVYDIDSQRPMIDFHVWIGRLPVEFARGGVIDATADQAEGDLLAPYEVATHDELLKRVLHTWRLELLLVSVNS